VGGGRGARAAEEGGGTRRGDDGCPLGRGPMRNPMNSVRIPCRVISVIFRVFRDFRAISEGIPVEFRTISVVFRDFCDFYAISMRRFCEFRVIFERIPRECTQFCVISMRVPRNFCDFP